MTTSENSKPAEPSPGDTLVPGSRRRLVISLGMLAILVGFAMVGLRWELAEVFAMIRRASIRDSETYLNVQQVAAGWSTASGVFLTLLGIVSVLFGYLQGDVRGERVLGGEFQSEDRPKEADGPHANEVAEFAKRSSEQHDPSRVREDIDHLFETVRNRIRSEILNLRRQAITNLILGSVTTLLAVGILAWVALGNEQALQPPYWLSALKAYVPRLTLALFIEVFAFFFLKLYRTTLGEIKYFQNELTNIEMPRIALAAALTLEDSAAVDAILARLASVERNFILKPGESTVQLEHLKHENEGLKAVLANVGAALGSEIGSAKRK